MSYVDGFFNDRQAAREAVVGTVDTNPDEAARAIELSRITGVPSLAVAQDLPTFERDAKTELATEIINSNTTLQEYINSNPMAARISNDDWGNLDGITKRVAGLSSGLNNTLIHTAHSLIEGITEAGDLGSWQINTPEKMKWFESLNPYQAKLTYIGYGLLGLPIEVPARILGGLNRAGATFAERSVSNITGDTALGGRIGREVGAFIEYTFNRPPGAHVVYGGVGAAAQMNAQLRHIADTAGPYIRAGVEPPIGINEAIDGMKKEQSRIDGQELAELTSEVQQSATRVRSPELFADMLRMQTQANIYIPFDAVARIYGDKPIRPDDNVLGWVPDIQAQVRTMSLTGGDIVIPLADWLAKSDKVVAKDLHDSIRVRRGGFTIEEAKEFDEVRRTMADIEVFHGSPYSFEAFSMERIGTGEGAQSYGHGLYFAQNRLVAEDYAQRLADIREELPSGELPEKPLSPQLYRARIRAQPEDFLQYDLSLNEQAAIIAKLQGTGLAERVRARVMGATGWEYSPRVTGQELYDAIRAETGSPAAASKALREAGIPGIRYLDQGSRQGKDDLVIVKDAQGNKVAEYTDENAAAEHAQRIGGTYDIPDTRTYNYVLFDDSLVEILDRNGEAIQAVRQQARFDMGLEVTQKVSPTISVTTGPMSPVQKVMFRAVDDLLKRIAPGAERMAGQRVEMKGAGEVQGAYQSFQNRKPLILWSFASESPMATARHEAVHFLREYGFFTSNEWEALRTAAIEGDWIEKHSIKKRYEGLKLTEEQMIEESIAEEYSKTWARTPGNVQSALGRAFEKLHMLLVEIKEAITKALGYEPKPDEIFAMVESGEVGARTGTEALSTDVIEGRAQQLELDVTRQSDKAIFEKASAIGMTVDQYKRYLKLIEKRNLEDIQAQRERAIAFEKKRQSAEWRQESEAIEDDVRADLRNRPDIAAAEFFRYGELYGQKIDGPRPKLNPELLTPEQRKLLPDNWLSPKGLHPDDAAGLFGYQTGAELIERLAAFETARGNIRPGEFFHRMVKAEVEKRMTDKYGELDSNILSAAEDHVLGITQMDLLHEETVALGSRSGSEISFKKEDVQDWAAMRFNEANANKVSAVRFLDEAGKAGRAAELALLKGDYAEAFRQKQRQYLSALMAKEAKTFEKETQRFERLALRFSRREGPKGVEQTFTDQIQDLLRRAELPVRRTGPELVEAFERAGYRTLDDFVQAQVADGYELAVQPYLSGQIKTAENMTVQEAREFRTAIRSLAHVGREVKQLELAGAKEDFDIFRQKVLDNITQLPFRPKETQGRWFYKWDAMQTKVEEMVKDLDLRKELGPLFDALIRPMAEAKHQEYSMLEKLAARFSELRGATKDWQKTLDEAIPQNFFLDPNGTPFELTRQDMIGMMLNFGNKSNREKFINGWKGKEEASIFEQKLRIMFDQNARKEDWDFVQNIWDVFEMWRKDANEMYYQLSGVPPKWIEPEAFTNAHGNYRGGYFPVIYDKYWSGIEAQATSRANVMFGANYHRSTPANHYTKERTGFVDYVEFQGSIEQVAARMQQEIHDIAYRRPLIAAKKVLSDKQIRAAIRQHYGAEYEAQLTPWMQKIASHYQMDEQAVAGANALLRRIRYNLIGHALPLNLKVLLSPSTGVINPINFGSMLWNRKANEALAYGKSKEIPHTFRNMDRDFRERLEATINAKGFNAVQADILRGTFWPAVWVEQQFRIRTFATEYQNNLVKGMSDGDATAAADSIVRERHGSAGLPDLPSIMSSNEAMKTYTMFYGFFNTMYNWQRQIPGQVRRGEYGQALKTLYGAILLPSAFGALLFNQQRESDSWWKVIGKALLLQPLSTLVFARELGSIVVEGFPSKTGLGGLFQAMRVSSGDILKAWEKKEIKKPIQHTANVIGLATGLPLAQVGRTSQFGADVYTNKQRPRNFQEWFRGIVTGEARLKK